MTTVEFDKISDLDGISVATRSCVYCNLNFQEEFMIRKLCMNCRRLFVLYQINQMLQKLVLPSLFFAIILYFIGGPLRQFAAIPAVIIIGPAFILGIFQEKLHFRGIETRSRLIPLLRYSKMLNDNGYYNSSIELWNLNYDNYSEIYRIKVLREFVISILVRVKPSPSTWLDDLRKPTGMSENEFVEHLFEVTEIRETLEVTKGTGTLPDIWEYIDSDELKVEIMNILSDNVEELYEATDAERKLFLEDLYLIDEDLMELVETNSKWINIKEALESFEPEIPPKNMFEEVKMNTQSQSEMQQLINN